MRLRGVIVTLALLGLVAGCTALGKARDRRVDPGGPPPPSGPIGR